MNCKLFVIKVARKDKDGKVLEGKYFYNFYLCFENGKIQPINALNGESYSNFQILFAFATLVKDYGEIKY